MFKYSKEHNGYVAKIGSVSFLCEEVSDEMEEQAMRLAECYEEKLPEIIDFILPELEDVFGELTSEEVEEALGSPLVDLDTEMIMYLEQTLDELHEIDVEYGGDFDEIYNVSIDG